MSRTFATEAEVRAYYDGVRAGLEQAAWSPADGWSRYVGSADYMGRGTKTLEQAIRDADQCERILSREIVYEMGFFDRCLGELEDTNSYLSEKIEDLYEKPKVYVL